MLVRSSSSLDCYQLIRWLSRQASVPSSYPLRRLFSNQTTKHLVSLKRNKKNQAIIVLKWALKNWKISDLQIYLSYVFLSFPSYELEAVSLLPMWYDSYFNSFVTVCEVQYNSWMKEVLFTQASSVAALKASLICDGNWQIEWPKPNSQQMLTLPLLLVTREVQHCSRGVSSTIHQSPNFSERKID